MSAGSTTRRKLLVGAGSLLSLRAQQYPARDNSRVPAMDELKTVLEFEAVAFAKLTREAYTFTAYGSEGEFTLRRNRQAFDWVELIPKAVVDVSSIDTASTLLGTPMAFPIMAAPTAGHAELHRDGELGTHQGATAAASTPMIVSNNASFPMDKIAAAAKGPLWFQLYPRQDLNATRALLDAAVEAGSKAVVMTVDQQAAYYERPIHNRHLSPPRQTRAAAAPANPYRVPEARLWYDWKYAESVRTMLKVPLIAKGILTAEDARLAMAHGFDAVYVSNHGGRSLDYDSSSLEVLPEIVDAVGGRVPVLFDSGVLSGTDILKALALGAKAVCVGRGIRWGLAAYGAPGVQRVLEMLQAELVTAMAQCGRPNLAALDRTMVRVQFP